MGTPRATRWPIFSLGGVEERGNLEALLPEPRIVGQRQAEIARAHDRHAQPAIETEDLPQVPAADP